MQERTIKVVGMTCGRCKASVEKALLGLAGVQTAEVDLDAGVVAVVYKESLVNDAALRGAIEDIGFQVR